MSRPGDKWNIYTITTNWWRHVNKTETCWLWTGYQKHGYPYCTKTLTGESRAHRASYVLHYGPIPEGMDIDHLCNVRLCVRPTHLEAVTTAENNRRMHKRKATT